MGCWAEKLYQDSCKMAYGKTVSDAFEGFLRDNDRKIAEGKDRNLKVEQLKMQKQQQEQAAAMDRFNQAFQTMNADKQQENILAERNIRENEIAREQENLNNQRAIQREQYKGTQAFNNADREDRQLHALELQGIKSADALKEAQAKANSPAKLKTLSEGGLDNLSGALSTLNNSFGEMKASTDKIRKVTGPISGVLKGNNPYKRDAQMLKNQLDISRQKIGKLLEGGKLIGADEEKYKRMMPSLSDTPVTFMDKLRNIENELKADIQINMESKSAAGYNTEGVQAVVDKYLSPKEAKDIDSMSDEDAIKKAKAMGLM